MADTQFGFDIDNRGYPDKANLDTSCCSDFDDFEKLSIPCSEAESEHEAVVDAADSERVLKSTDTKRVSETAYTAPFSSEVRKPPVMSVPSALTEVCRQSLSPGRVERSALCNSLIEIANSHEKFVV